MLDIKFFRHAFQCYLMLLHCQLIVNTRMRGSFMLTMCTCKFCSILCDLSVNVYQHIVNCLANRECYKFVNLNKNVIK